MTSEAFSERRSKELMRAPSSHRQANELRQSEARYHTDLDAAFDAIITITSDGTIRWFNRGAERIFGHRAEEVIGRQVALLMPERYRDLCAAGLHRYLETGGGRVVGGTAELMGLRKDGSEFPIELSLGEAHEGKARLFTAVIRDITDRKGREEERARLAAIVESSEDAIIGKTLGGTITTWNKGAERLYGYSAKEAVGKHISMLVPPERPGEIPRILESVRRGEKVDHFETVRVTKDGRRLDISLTVSPIKDSEGNVVGASTIARDITVRKEAEEAQRFLAEAGEMLSSSLDYRVTLASVARLAVPTLADWCAVNILEGDSLERLAIEHTDPEKVALALKLQERYPDDPETSGGIPNVLRTGRPEIYPEITDEMLETAARDEEHLSLLREIGSTSVIIVPMAARGRTLGAIILVSAESGRRYGEADLELAQELARRAAMAVDNARLYAEAQREISERRRTETRYRTLVEQIPAVTYIQEPLESRNSKAVTYMSPQYETMLGYPAELEVLDEEHWHRILHPEDRQRVLAEEARTDETGEPFKVEYRIIAGDGRVVWVRDQATLVRDEEGHPLYWLGVQYDITEQKRSEEALREARDRFRSVFDHAPIGVAVVSLGGRYLQVNRSLCEILGYSEDELLATTWQEITHPGDLADSWARAYQIADGEIPSFHLEKRFLHADGHTVWASLSVSLVRNSEGEPLYFISQIQDVTARKDAEAALRRSEASLAAAQRLAHLGNWISDLETGEMYWSDELYRILGFEPQELVPSCEHFLDSVHPEDRERVENLLYPGLSESQRHNFEFRIIYPDGAERIVYAQAEVDSDEAGKPTSVLGVVDDITERKNLEETIEELLRQHKMLLQSAGEGIFGLDMHGNFTFVNPIAARMTGWNTQELLGRPMHDLLHHTRSDGTTCTREECPIYAPLEDDVVDHCGGEEVFWRKDGTSFPVEYTSTAIVEDDEIVGAVVTFKDITERKELEGELFYRAFHDALTGLPNRALFMDRLEHALTRTGRQGGKVAVLFMDLDNFKLINDSLGHKAGDQLLVTVAQRLKACLRPEDTAARIGGDEFAILVEDVNSVMNVARVAERIAQALRPVFTLNDQEVFATVSIGIALSSSAQELPEDLLRYADLAMYRAKDEGKAHYELFQPNMHTNVQKRLVLETELRRAIEQQQLRVYYQPVVALESGKIAGVEALVRWDHPERGLLLPESFLSVAEETGLIIQIGRWVLREACKQARTWQERYPSAPPVTISVNLSPRQFFHSELVAEILDETEVDAGTLQLEITEGALTSNNARSADETLRNLKDLGVQLAIDDFGVGYSSLSYLKRFPVDYLKIDRSFVAGLGHDPNNGASKDAKIVSALIRLTHALELEVIAEGVETAEQLAWLRDAGCNLAQGNYFLEPLPAEALSVLLRDNFGNRGWSGNSSAL